MMAKIFHVLKPFLVESAFCLALSKLFASTITIEDSDEPQEESLESEEEAPVIPQE